MLELNQLHFQYAEHLAFEFSLKLESSDALAIIGSSGSGKSTLLNLIAGFLVPDHGEIIFDRENITNLPPNKRPANMLFQENNLFPHLNVFQNIAVGLNPGLKINNDQHAIIEHSLKRVGLTGFNNRFPHQLSGGQRQRVAIARTIVRNRPILLLDEPFSFLDPPLRLEMLDLVKGLQIERSFTMIMVTHDYNDCRRVCNKTCFIHQGKILHIDSTSQFASTANIPVIKAYLGNAEISN